MNVGDIVRILDSPIGSPILLGIIIKQLGYMEIGLQVYHVMRSDGFVGQWTSAALRKIK